MVSQIVVGVGFLMMLLIWAAVLGSVQRDERFAFGLGVILMIIGLTFLSETASGIVALVGFLVVVASTVPLLREQPG